jgi:hypothetical protein
MALTLGSIGCVRTPIPIISAVNTEPTPTHIVTRTDLPTNWVEVKQQNVSYGLPAEFDRVTLALPPDILSRHYSHTHNLTIDCYVRISNIDLHEYVLDNFILPRSGKVITVRENSTGVVAVQSVDGTTSSLDFFIKKNSKIYQLTCFSDTISLKNNATICFKVVDTFRI